MLLFNIEQCIRHSELRKSVTAVIVLDTRSIQQITKSVSYATGAKIGAALIDRLKNLLRSQDVISKGAQLTESAAPAGASSEDSSADAVKPSAAVARSEGDELVMLVSDIKADTDVAAIVERIRKSFELAFAIDGHEYRLDSCMGISICGIDAHNASQMLQNASVACSNALNMGRRNEYCYYSKEIESRAKRKFRLANDLQGAAARGELRLAYQPKFSLTRGALTGW